MAHDPAYHALAGEVRARLPVDGRPLLVGLAGAVAVGKSTTAAILAELLAGHGVRTDVLCTDCFLHPNAVLAERDLTMRKGYPETFDADGLAACLDGLRRGEVPVPVPVYSHAVYDVVPGEELPVGLADVVVVEGVNALQPPAAGMYDLAVYVDADEAHVRQWFVGRFLELCDAADDGAEGFYRMFCAIEPDARRAVAEGAWDGINGPNLRDHIAPSRAHADLVLRKAADHSIVELAPRTAR